MSKSTVYGPAEVQRIAREKMMRKFAVALPGVVVAFHAGASAAEEDTITVQPGVHRLVPTADEDDFDSVEKLPQLQDVPVVWPRGRGFLARGTLHPGDTVLLVAMDRDMDNFRGTGQPSEPFDARMHDWHSCCAIPGLTPRAAPAAPTDAAALASALDKLISAIKAVTPAGSETGLGALIGNLNTLFPGIVQGPPVEHSPWGLGGTGSPYLLSDKD